MVWRRNISYTGKFVTVTQHWGSGLACVICIQPPATLIQPTNPPAAKQFAFTRHGDMVFACVPGSWEWVILSLAALNTQTDLLIYGYGQWLVKTCFSYRKVAIQLRPVLVSKGGHPNTTCNNGFLNDSSSDILQCNDPSLSVKPPLFTHHDAEPPAGRGLAIHS